MKVLINREEHDPYRGYQLLNWYIPTGIRHPEPKFNKLEYSLRLSFNEWENGDLFLREECCDIEARHQNLIDINPPLKQIEVEEQQVKYYLEKLKEHHLRRAGYVDSFMQTLIALNKPLEEED